MNKLAALLSLAISTTGVSQVVYTFGPAGAYPNPGWTSASNTTPANRVLNYQNNLGTISSNDTPAGNRYVNGQRTSYTSPDINTTCANASTVSVALVVDYDLENTYDWGYFQYSLNGGTTWINPVPLSASNNNSGTAVNLSAYPPLTTWTNNASNRNGWTNYGTVTLNLIIPTSATTRFRFIFASDASTNYYTSFFTDYDYYFDVNSFVISCNVVMPVELSSFSGYHTENTNSLDWQTETEQDNDYFTLQWTSDPDSEIWNDIAYIKGQGNSETVTSYHFDHEQYDQHKLNYYRLVQVDQNGTMQVYPDYVSIDNQKERSKKVVKLVNLLGQEVDSGYTGVAIQLFDDGTTLKVYKNPE